MCIICSMTTTFDPDRHPGEGPLYSPIVETTDATASIDTIYSMTVGDVFSGELSTLGEQDWVEVTLDAGSSYSFALTGAPSGDGTLDDPLVRLFDASGTQIGSNDDGGTGLESLLTFTATTSGTYYFAADSYNGGSTGTYTLSFDAASPAENGTLDELAAFLTEGYWGGSERSYDTSTSNQITVNISALTAEGQQLAQWAFEGWEAVANLDFVVTTGDAQITFDDDQSGAFARSVRSFDGSLISGEVNVSTAWLAGSGTSIDSYSFQTYMHEIGHALGLGHQGGYNGSANFGVDNTFLNDSWQMSLMSYFSQSENTTTTASYGFTLTAMMADIVAIQNLYGAPTASSQTAGDTTWGYNSNLDGYLGDFFDLLDGGTGGGNFVGNRVVFTIYDQGGTDTIDLSGSTTDDRIDLREETFSDVLGRIGTLGIARGAVIENAIGGSGDDTITGNDVANSLEGGAGADTIIGGGGDDTIIGGGGNDTIIGGTGQNVALYEGSFFDYALTKNEALSFTVVGTSAEDLGTDQLSDIDELQFSDGTFDGFVFTTEEVVDVADAFGRTSSFETYDIDAKRVSRTVAYDNGLVAETSYDNGIRTSVTTTDVNDAFNWTSTVDVYDANGERTSQTKISDGGLNTETTYVSGVKTVVSKDDDGDQYSWENTTDTYDANGDVVGRSITFDDNRVIETVFSDGIKVSTTRIDAADTFVWDRLKNTYDTDGSRLSTELTYDSGLKTETTFEDGVITSTLTSDTGGDFNWTSIERRFDASGDTEGMTNIYDDGRVLETEYTNGIRTTGTMTDVADAHTWASYVDTYNSSGAVTQRSMTFDDGSETTWVF